MGIAGGIIRGLVGVAAMAAVEACNCGAHVTTDDTPTSCTIDGTSVAARDHNPQNLNQCCLPALNAAGWSDWFQDGGQITLGDGGYGWWWVGDFNGDGRPDVITGAASIRDDAGIGGALVQLNTGHGSFAPPVSYPFAAPVPLQLFGFAHDLDGDGYDDLILVALGCCLPVPEARVIMNQRDGTFGAPMVLPDSTTLWELIPADANGDGIPDLFSTGYGDAGVQLRIGMGNGSFEPPVSLDTGFGDAFVTIQVASLRGNNVLDLLTFFFEGPDQGRSGIGVSLGDGKGHFSPPTVYEPSGLEWDGFEVQDFNGDGFPDVLIFDRFPGVWADERIRTGVLHGNGDGTLGNHIEEVDLDPASVDVWFFEAGQLTPGASDFVSVSSYPGDAGPGSETSQTNVYWRLPDGGLSAPMPLGPPGGLNDLSLLVSDLSGDGVEDILIVSGVFGPTLGQVYLNACGAPLE